MLGLSYGTDTRHIRSAVRTVVAAGIGAVQFAILVHLLHQKAGGRSCVMPKKSTRWYEGGMRTLLSIGHHRQHSTMGRNIGNIGYRQLATNWYGHNANIEFSMAFSLRFVGISFRFYAMPSMCKLEDEVFGVVLYSCVLLQYKCTENAHPKQYKREDISVRRWHSKRRGNSWRYSYVSMILICKAHQEKRAAIKTLMGLLKIIKNKIKRETKNRKECLLCVWLNRFS